MSTFDSSAFFDKVDGKGDRNIYFNGKGDGDVHGHVKESGRDSTSKETRYRFVRDVEENNYIDDGSSLMYPPGYFPPPPH